MVVQSISPQKQNIIKNVCFELNSPLSNRTFVIVAENSTTLQEWMTAIRKAMLKIRRDRSKTEAQKRKNKQDDDDGLSTDSNNNPNSNNNNNNNSGDSSTSNPSISQDSTSSHPLNIHTQAPSSPDRRLSTSPKQDKSIIDIAQSRSRPTSQTAKHQTHAHPPTGDGKDNEKFGVYLQWLEETKDKRKSVSTQPQDLNGGSNVLHRHLLTEEEQNKKQCFPCCPPNPFPCCPSVKCDCVCVIS